MPITTDSTSSQYYQHIADLPLSKFIEVATNGNFFALVISGQPSLDDLRIAWESIVSEYGEAVGSGQQELSTNLYKQIVKLETTIAQIEMLVRALEKTYCGKFVTLLNGLLTTSFVFDVDKPQEYNKKLQACISRSKGFKITLDLKVAQYNAINKKTEQGEAMTKEAFIGVLITLSDHAKYPIHDNITVFEYCERIKRLNEYIRKMDKK